MTDGEPSAEGAAVRAVLPRVERAPGTSSFEEELAAHLRNRLRLAFGALGIVVAVMWVGPRLLRLVFLGWLVPPFTVFDLLHLGSVFAILAFYLSLRRGSWPYARVVRADSGGFVTGIAITLTLMALSNWQVYPFVYCVLLLFVIVRAVVVPSSGLRTLVLSSVAVVGLVAVLVLNRHLVASPEETASRGTLLTYSGLYVVVMLLAVGVAAFASRVNFSLRRQVFDANRLGQYVLSERIGSGGMGEVYRATHALLKRPTAVKLLRPEITGREAIARFEHEVRQTSRLTHPNTIAIYDYGHTAEGVFYYAMELLDGADLSRIVRETGPMPAGRAIHVLAQICGALGEAHSLGLIHRDVKPGNVILGIRGGEPDVAKVLDFGLVKELDAEGPGLTRAGLFVGTPETAAPEMFFGKAGRAADLYSLGAVGYFLLAGRPPFVGEDVGDLVRQHLQETPEPPSAHVPEVPGDLERVILRCLEKEPERRPESAEALRSALLACGAAGTWSREDAAAWWESFRARPADQG